MTESLYNLITAWQNKVFTKATPLSCVNHLQEEVEELKKSIEMGKADPDEIADCFMLLINICNKSGMTHDDVWKALWDKLIICQSRQWGEPNGKGYVKHIKEPTTTVPAPCRVRITQCSFEQGWYRNMIGQEVDVDNAGGVFDFVLWEDYINKATTWRHIKKVDCEIISTATND